MSRKKKDPRIRKKTITFSMSDVDLGRLEVVAKILDVNKSEAVRWLVENALEQHDDYFAKEVHNVTNESEDHYDNMEQDNPKS